MREPIATAPATATATSTTTMFGISNVQIVQSFNGLPPPLKADSPMSSASSSLSSSSSSSTSSSSAVHGAGPGTAPPVVGILRSVSRASSIGGTLKSASSGSGASSPAVSVKRNSSSSSFGSSSDRRSVFYTDPLPDSDQSSRTTEATTNGRKYDAMTNDAHVSPPASQQQQQQRTGKSVEIRPDETLLRRLGDGQTRRKQQRPATAASLLLEGGGVIGPRTHLKLVSQELEWERKFRDDQLSRILKALIAFETRLKNEQVRIRQQLYEKDDVINRQNSTINRMKRKLQAEEGEGTDSPTEQAADEVAQYCPKCRKNYYRLECRNNGTQTFQYCAEDGAESVNTENLSLNSVEYASSSEEQESSLYVRANSFKDARRSRKYTSKRSYQGYHQRPASRASSFKSNASGRALAKLTERNEGRDAIRLSSGAGGEDQKHRERRGNDDSGNDMEEEEDGGHEAYVNIEPNANVPKIVIYENYESDKENNNQRQRQRRPAECNNYDNVEPYSNRIDSLHGIHGQRQQQQQQQNNHNSNEYHLMKRQQDGTSSSEQMELDDGTIFYEAVNTSGGSVGNQAKYTEGMEMRQTIETNDDWYASASDMEDSDTALGKPYSNAAVNPVLECVNQILLQQSMDGFGEGNSKDTRPQANGGGDEHKADGGLQQDEEEEERYIRAQEPQEKQQQQQQQQQPATAKDPHPVRSKRVHFSTQNSMVQVPRITLPDPGGGGGSCHRKEPTYEIQSIYSNEYEPIGSEQNSYSNYYVDMESKLGSEDRERELALAEKRKTPPALPPKPANLLKLSKATHQQRTPIGAVGLPKGAGGRGVASSGQSDIAESEPDYCSISEIQDSVAKCVQIVAEIHKDACEDDYSIVDDETDEGEKKKAKGEGQASVEMDGKKVQELEESFADVPKLPNVAEIVVPPKKEPLSKFISQDNYITKSSGSSGSGSITSGSSNKLVTTSGVSSGTVGSVPGTPNKKDDGEFREQLSEIIAEINKQSPAIRTASKKQIPVKELGSPFRGVSQLRPSGGGTGAAFQSKLKPVDKLSFLSKSGSGSIPSLNHHHHQPKLGSSIARPSIKPTLLKSSLSTKALSSTNLTLGNNLNSPFGSPVKAGVSYIPNLKSLGGGALSGSVRDVAGSTNGGLGTPLKSASSTSSLKKVAPATPGSRDSAGGATPSTATNQTGTTSGTTVPVIIAEDSKLPIQAEFDWYNLDAEYGKSNQPDVIVEAEPTVSGSTGPSTDEEQNPSPSETTKADATNGKSSGGDDAPADGACSEELENVEYNLDEEYKSLGPIVPPPDIIQKGSAALAPMTPPKNGGKIPYNSLSFKELMQLNETPKMIGAPEKAARAPGREAPAATGGGDGGATGTGNYEHFLDDSGLCSKPIILPRKKRVYYSGPFV